MRAADRLRVVLTPPHEPGALVPVRTEARAHAGRAVLWAGLALIALQALLRGWAGLRGSLSQDDYVFEYRAATMSLRDPHYLLDAYNGHLMPGSFLLVRLATRVSPLQVWPTVAMDLVLQAATGLALLLLLRELFGVRRGILVPLTLFLFTPVTLTGFVWWAAALNQLPAMLAMTVCLHLHVLYLRSGRLRTGLWSVVAFLVGLAFFEKLLLFAPLIPLLTALYFVPGTWWRRLVGAVRLHWQLWVAWSAVLGLYVAYYRSSVESTLAGGSSPGGFLDLLGTSWTALRAGSIGGPWSWFSLGDSANAIPLVSSRVSLLSWLALLVVVAGGAAALRMSARAWLLPLAYYLGTVALLAAGRNQIGPVIGLAYRYFAEVALLSAVALALAVLPIRGRVARGEVTTVEPRLWLQALRARVGAVVGRPWSPSGHSRTVAVRLGIVLFVVSSTVSTLRYDAAWSANPGSRYLDLAQRELARAPDVVLVDTAVPGGMMEPLFNPYNSVSHVLAPLPHPPTVLTVGHASPRLSMLDDTGRIRQVAIEGLAAQPGPRKDCGWFGTGAAGLTALLPLTTFDYVWTIRIGYLASGDSRAVVSAGRRSIPVQLQAGLNALYLVVDGAVSGVRIDGLDPDVSVCTDDVRIGKPVPLP